MASTMVMDVNHVNLSTDVGKSAASTIPRVSDPLSSRMREGPHYRTKAKRKIDLASLEEQY
jgi:hypothetical protein